MDTFTREALSDSDYAPIADTPAPDLIVGRIDDIYTFGAAEGLGGYAIGWTECNIGDAPAMYAAPTNQHPAMSQSLFRLKDGRFEQIGASWIMHGFASLASNTCCPFGVTCCQDPDTATLIGAGCSNPHASPVNGAQSYLTPRSEINAWTGAFPFPKTAPPLSDPPKVYERRLQVRQSDLDPALNEGAEYFAEVLYVAADDAAAGNHENNASYRQIVVLNVLINGAWTMTDLSPFPTVSDSPAIHAWSARDTSVHTVVVRVPDEGVFHLAAKATDFGSGIWEYEYALYNLNSHRSAGSFSVPFTPGTNIQNVGFHDVDYHSGDPIDGTDWQTTIGEDYIAWETTPFEINENANALRWGTLYNFRFQADSPPTRTSVTIGLFRPGEPDAISAPIPGPS